MFKYDKKWYQSKTVWASAAVFVVSVVKAMFGEGSVPVELVTAILGALGLYGRFTATKTIK